MLPRLRKHDSSFRTRWLALILAGAVVCMIGPLLFGSGLWLRQFNGRSDVHHPWLWHVGMVALWFLPIMFLVEWVTRGKLFENTVEEMSDVPRQFGSGRIVGGAFIAEMCLWGPRMVTGGVRQNIGLTRHRKADRLLAAAMLAELTNRGESLPIGELFKLAHGRDDAFGDALAYLMFHDLVDTSKTGDRAWLTSGGKRSLGLQ
jgi:hypothetical protein